MCNSKPSNRTRAAAPEPPSLGCDSGCSPSGHRGGVDGAAARAHRNLPLALLFPGAPPRAMSTRAPGAHASAQTGACSPHRPYVQMAFKPNSDVTKKLLTGAKTLVPFAIVYALLLAASWTPDSLSQLLPGSLEQGVKNAKAGKFAVEFMPTADTVGKLLSQPLASLSAWAHLQFIAFFCARWIWLDGVSPAPPVSSCRCPRLVRDPGLDSLYCSW